jgi:hypothetical protein
MPAKLEYLAVGNVEADLSRQLFGSIGTTKAYETRKAYLQQVKTRATESVNRIREKIALLDVNPEKSFEGGCEFLLNWYNEIKVTEIKHSVNILLLTYQPTVLLACQLTLRGQLPAGTYLF